MKTELLKRARRLWMTGWAPRHVQRHNVRSYARSVAYLGPKWIMCRPVREANHG